MSLYTVGHSSHTLEHFLELLGHHSITYICDVRSSPYSRYARHFNREALEQSLQGAGIRYLFMGNELGGRGRSGSQYVDGQVQYCALAASSSFQAGLERVRREATAQTVCLMCAEKDPLNCHRAILVCRHLRAEIAILHILADSNVESTTEFEERLLKSLKLPTVTMFEDHAAVVERAYDLQGSKIAFRRNEDRTQEEE